jgi:YhcH/YjgK/YiaL family protein
MVLDLIKNYELYANITERLAQGFDFIINSDLKTIKLGTYEIDGTAIFAVVQKYTTKKAEDSFLGRHTKYIDIQYMIYGEELTGIASKTDQKILSFDVEKGMFTLFSPDDLHRPCIRNGEIASVKKSVIKVLI